MNDNLTNMTNVTSSLANNSTSIISGLNLDNTAISQLGLVPSLGVLFAITITLSLTLFYNKIVQIENKVEEKIKSDVIRAIQEYYDHRHRRVDEERLSDGLTNLMRVKDYIAEGKNLFMLHLLVSAIISIIAGIGLLTFSNKLLLFGVGTIAIGWHLFSWNNLRIRVDKLEKYLKNVPMRQILGEDYQGDQ